MLGFNKYIFLILIFVVSGCSDSPLNSPYGKNVKNQKVFYSSFQERPKHLDPARSYSSNEYAFLAQIYEPLFQYHYLKKPYEIAKNPIKIKNEKNFYKEVFA